MIGVMIPLVLYHDMTRKGSYNIIILRVFLNYGVLSFDIFFVMLIMSKLHVQNIKVQMTKYNNNYQRFNQVYKKLRCNDYIYFDSLMISIRYYCTIKFRDFQNQNFKLFKCLNPKENKIAT